MTIAMILTPALFLLIALIYAEKTESPKRILIFKAPLSFLFIIAWFIHPAQHPLFANLVFVALVFCLAGDVLLAIGSPAAFLAGLVSFLLGHVMYAGAFFLVADVGAFMAVGVMLLALSAALIWRWLSPHLGNMQNPVMAYIVVISIMVAGAFGIFGNATIAPGVRAIIFTGAVLFYASDLFVARQRFVVNAQINRTVGLPLYYTAQFMLAFSAAWMPG